MADLNEKEAEAKNLHDKQVAFAKETNHKLVQQLETAVGDLCKPIMDVNDGGGFAVDRAINLSLAISLRRIADALEGDKTNIGLIQAILMCEPKP